MITARRDQTSFLKHTVNLQQSYTLYNILKIVPKKDSNMLSSVGDSLSYGGTPGLI